MRWDERLTKLAGIALAAIVAALNGCSDRPAAAADYESEGQKFRVETLAKRDDVVWGFDFLPGGDLVFTERGGYLGLLNAKTGEIRSITPVPQVAVKGQGGLLDVKVHPEFAENRWIYLSYSEPVGDKMTTALGRGKLIGSSLTDYKKLFSAFEPNSNEIHFGSRIEFDGSGHLFLSVGERNERDKAQNLAYDNGKILRFDEDGNPAAGNPFAGKPTARAEIWSYGHRNPQGLTRNPATGDLWAVEFGPMGGDEVNLIKPGANYGWPIVTYGREYYGPKIGEGFEKPGIEAPIAYYVPSISPSGAAFYSGDVFPKWKGNLFIAALQSTHLRRLVLNGHAVIRQEEMLKDQDWRFRHVRQGPDGLVYFSTDGGIIGRLVPVPSSR